MHLPLQIQEEIYSTTIFSAKAGKLILGKIIYNIRQCCGSVFQDPGSGIRCLFDPWIRDPGWVESQHQDPGSGMNNPDHIF